MLSKIIKNCQLGCKSKLQDLFFFGYVPSVNSLRDSEKRNISEQFFPLDLLICPECKLGQISCIVDRQILFPKTYPYTSSTTKILRDNFKNLSIEVDKFKKLSKKDLIVDIGSNDGNLLSNFKEKSRVLGVTPENIGKIAINRGIPTILDYFDDKSVRQILKKNGKATIVTATNVFAHIDNMSNLILNIKKCLSPDGIFISESHYFLKVINEMQYDTVYHEHLRYYSLTSLKIFLEKFGLYIFYAKEIKTHGGSIRVYASRKNYFKIHKNVKKILNKEKKFFRKKFLNDFKINTFKTKINLLNLIRKIKIKKLNICGVGAPSRSSTLINYVGIDEKMINSILEVKDSHKINNFVPGTKIPIINENSLLKWPEYLIIFSWHIKDELKKIFKKKGFKGKFIIPLPKPHIES